MKKKLMGDIKTTNISSVKDTVNEENKKKNHRPGENICKTHIRLVSKIYKELLKINKNKQHKTNFKNRGKYQTDTLSKKIYNWQISI